MSVGLLPSPTEEQALLLATTGRFIEAELPLAAVRARADGAAGPGPEYRRGAASLGWFGLLADEHTDHDYNAAVARYVVQVSATSPELLYRARRPVIEVVTRLIAAAMAAGQLAPGDPERAAASVYLAHNTAQTAGYLGNSIGAALPSIEELLTFILRGLGAPLPDGWVDRLRVSDEDAARYRLESELAAGTLPRVHAQPSGTA